MIVSEPPSPTLLPSGRSTPAAEVSGARGWLAFCFKLPRELATGSAPGRVSWQPLGAAGIFRFLVTRTPQAVGLHWIWEGPEHQPHNLRLLVPSLPGGEWMHLAVDWDAAAGVCDVFLDGAALREAGVRLPPWSPSGSAACLEADCSDVAIAGLECLPECPGVPAERVPENLRGALDGALGLIPRGPLVLPPEERRHPVYSSSLADGVDAGDWIFEGPAVLKRNGSDLRVASAEDGVEDTGHLVFWLRRDLPANFLAEWTVRSVGTHGLNIVFFCARGRNGADALDSGLAPRDGTFGQYHSGDIDCLHISYHANTPAFPGRPTSNLRKNHGFHLAANGLPGIPAGSHSRHKVSLLKTGARVRLAVDGELKIDWTDDGQRFGPVLGAGKFGLRQMVWSVCDYGNLDIREVDPE